MAYEHDEDFEGHLALLLHVVVLAMDSDEPLVVGAAQVGLLWFCIGLGWGCLGLHAAFSLPHARSDPSSNCSV